jgi:16S rRNA (cytosine967-C5)-methyltransferase
MSAPKSSARAAALEAILASEQGGGFLRETLHAAFARMALEPRDRALATQIATGAVRHRRTLRLVLTHLRAGGARTAEIQSPLREILELGAFQLLFLDRVPAYAAINEAVEAARAGGGKVRDKAAGFVNGMLRGVQRLVVGRDPSGTPARDAIPHPEGGVIRLKEPVLPDPGTRAAFLGAAYSLPDWLVSQWLGHFGDGAAETICRASNRRPHVIARVNAAKWRPDDLTAKLRAESLEAAPGPRPGTLDVTHLYPLHLEAHAAAGDFTVQDPSAMAAVEALAPRPGESVLDLCASPGTKTTQIVEAMGAAGRLVACDRTEEKLVPVRQALAARGLAGATVCLSTDAGNHAPPGGFDAVLVDVPCSNTGVLARRVDGRWRLRLEDLEELARIQSSLLAEAARLVRPGGRLVYSTCSLDPGENDGRVRGFLEGDGRADWRLDRRDLVFPAPDHDGAFWALLCRR